MSIVEFLYACCLQPWGPRGLSAPVVVIVVIVYSGYGVAFSRAGQLMAAFAELAAAAREVAQAVLECLLCPA
jgi:hypothetical protein